MPLFLIMSGSYATEDMSNHDLVSGNGNVDELFKEFQAVIRAEIAKDDIPGTHRDMVDAAASRLGLTRPMLDDGTINHSAMYDYVPDYFSRWLQREKGFVVIEHAITWATDIEITG